MAKSFPIILFGEKIGDASTTKKAYEMVYKALPESKKPLLDAVELTSFEKGMHWSAFSGSLAFYEIENEDSIGKQIKIKGQFPNKTGIIISTFPAGVFHPEKLFCITVFGNLGGTSYLTESEFELID